MKIPVAETPSSQGGYIPEQTYRVRITDTKYTSANSTGNPMTTLSCEVIEPESVEVNGKTLTTAGKNFQMFLVHNFEKAGWGSQEEVLGFCQRLGVDVGEAYDTDLHEEYFKGFEFDIILRAKEEVKRYTQGPKRGQPLLDGEGKEIKSEMRINARPSDVLENCRPVKNQEVADRPF